MSAKISFHLEQADVREFAADVLILKYAQERYGVDRLVSYDLNTHGVELKKISPRVGKFILLENVGAMNFNRILFIGVKHIDVFGYKDIKSFATQSLSILKDKYPNAEHICMTMHGVGYGLDESEALLAQVAGLFEGIQNKNYPINLKKISIAELNPERVLRLQSVLESYLKSQVVFQKTSSNEFLIEVDNIREEDKRIDNTLLTSKLPANKGHIFVAMPFKEELYDTFYYGIQAPIHNNNFLCERIDEETFVGDILARMKSKIESASAVIADLTMQNPNVYLEVGYAWGIKKPTILLIKKGDILKFDVQGQRCLQYNGIKHLEELLNKEIMELIKSGVIK